MHALGRAVDGAVGGPPDEPGDDDSAGHPRDLSLARGDVGTEAGRVVDIGIGLAKRQSPGERELLPRDRLSGGILCDLAAHPITLSDYETFFWHAATLSRGA